MNRKFIWMLCLLFLSAVSVFAQGGQRRTVEERVKMTMDTLNLNLKLDATQSASTDSVFTSFYNEMDKLREAGTRPEPSVMEAKIAERDAKLKKIFTADQFTQFQAWDKARRERMRAQRGQ